MAEWIDHSEYDTQRTVTCKCGWKGSPNDCYSTLHAAFMDMHCPRCRQTVLIIDTLGTECGTFIPRPVPRLTFGKVTPDMERLISYTVTIVILLS